MKGIGKMAVNPPVRITRGTNPYSEGVQGQANEPITVAAFLDQSHKILGLPSMEWSLAEIWDRLEENAPRVAIIGGSPDHPAHIVDLQTSLRAAHRIWQDGGLPFYFSIPVLCDGTAQSNLGMSYSLQSRLAAAGMIVNQMEAHSYHGAFVIQGCDKTPMAILCALAHLDVVRGQRGDAPLFASFAPAHVLKGGIIPPDLRADIEAVAERCRSAGESFIAKDLLDALTYILQCSSNVQFEGAFKRAYQRGILNRVEHKELEKRLAIHTCDALGGVCAFNGTGNSSRIAMSALGLVHPAVDLLTAPPTQDQVDTAVDALFEICNSPEFSVSNLLAQNLPNAVRVHSATGGSTNLVMHLIAAMVYAGYDFDLLKMDAIHHRVPVPDLFDYSLTQGRDIFALAQQCCAGKVRGMETIYYELTQNGVPMHLDALTVTGTSWRQRLADPRGLSAANVDDNPIILCKPRRVTSGVDVLSGNWFESAVVKISGMPEHQLNEFDGKVAFVLFYENEEDANAGLLDVNLLANLRDSGVLSYDDLLGVYGQNQTSNHPDKAAAAEYGPQKLFDMMVGEGILKLAVIISGQGPEAFGMPEMFTPMQHINTNRQLRRMATIISDGRYSGVTYGAAIGHVTPEAVNGGGILYLQTGDILHLALRKRRIDLLDPVLLRRGEIVSYTGDLAAERADQGRERQERILKRRSIIATTNRLVNVTDAAHGIVPLDVAQEASRPYVDPTPL
jgi:dihydroxyacid dehydratase/phosphogluconate dehydratase